MTKEQIIEELKQKGSEWVQTFKELADVYMKATPEQKEMILDELQRITIDAQRKERCL